MSYRASIILLLGLVLAMSCGVRAQPAQAQEQFVGVGIAISVDDDQSVWVQKVLLGGPAARAGIADDDEILAIDGRSVADIEPQQLPQLIRGAAGSEVTLTVRTKGAKPRKVTMKREAIGVSQQPQQIEQPQKQEPLKPPAASPAPAPSQMPSGTIKFKRIGVNDPGINNIEAVSFLIPSDWKAEGGVQWFPDYSILANLLMKITDPHTGAQIEFLPMQNFTWLNQSVVPMQPGTNYMGNIVCQPIQDIGQFVQAMYMPQALPHLRGAKVVAKEDLPKVAAEVAKQYQGAGTSRAGRVRYEYLRDGKPWEEDVFVTLSYFPWQMGTIWSVNSAYAFRAPKGQLDKLTPVMNTTITTTRLSPDWYGGYMYVQKLFNDRMNNSIRNAKALSDTITRNSEEIRQMFADSYKQRNESQDRINQQFSEYIRGVNTYNDPFAGKPVELPSGYDHAWVNSRGEYILTNQAGFDPNVGDNVEWRPMQQKTQ